MRHLPVMEKAKKNHQTQTRANKSSNTGGIFQGQSPGVLAKPDWNYGNFKPLIKAKHHQGTEFTQQRNRDKQLLLHLRTTKGSSNLQSICNEDVKKTSISFFLTKPQVVLLFLFEIFLKQTSQTVQSGRHSFITMHRSPERMKANSNIINIK